MGCNSSKAPYAPHAAMPTPPSSLDQKEVASSLDQKMSYTTQSPSSDLKTVEWLVLASPEPTPSTLEVKVDAIASSQSENESMTAKSPASIGPGAASTPCSPVETIDVVNNHTGTGPPHSLFDIPVVEPRSWSRSSGTGSPHSSIGPHGHDLPLPHLLGRRFQPSPDKVFKPAVQPILEPVKLLEPTSRTATDSNEKEMSDELGSVWEWLTQKADNQSHVAHSHSDPLYACIGLREQAKECGGMRRKK